MCKQMLEERVDNSNLQMKVNCSAERGTTNQGIIREADLNYLTTERGCGRYGCNCVNYDRSNCIIF
ncbi:hypothetical protein HZC32_03415 [Candidatus Woesearchaeota archaeon]|nr:hypothetical protein [Candidatus Woesearchaeota archaeon]